MGRRPANTVFKSRRTSENCDNPEIQQQVCSKSHTSAQNVLSAEVCEVCRKAVYYLHTQSDLKID